MRRASTPSAPISNRNRLCKWIRHRTGAYTENGFGARMLLRVNARFGTVAGRNWTEALLPAKFRAVAGIETGRAGQTGKGSQGIVKPAAVAAGQIGSSHRPGERVSPVNSAFSSGRWKQTDPGVWPGVGMTRPLTGPRRPGERAGIKSSFAGRRGVE